ncbi:hypothetical protein SERLA73DRAFT_181162 [Serpula lacrymans var. lacrymans S7.3]|uniref:Uncharacterized protein n=2 Tax=Serpula lacrymans var. lacrymans TaxID=341189 RepID=F8PXK3_SERL3|nr:uncharacterized protein SERLADRAFT_467081 [Serpula lacrymans var. lacrymans S7.9]EGN98616.1 hypothetical protein SERLA73DRAFT_181162 [Serpula lacrymans var. lacrymans S7.3]EGO24183.1 hypothetical protein SERLADRAFT_467081 [Serpula lacrymans var. lacrymans S7.9]
MPTQSLDKNCKALRFPTGQAQRSLSRHWYSQGRGLVSVSFTEIFDRQGPNAGRWRAEFITDSRRTSQNEALQITHYDRCVGV